MIGPITIKVSASHPDVPLREVPVFTGSACTVGVTDVPAHFGGITVTGVSVTVEDARGESTTVSAKRSGCVWTATFAGSVFDLPGYVKNGLTVTAHGTDENEDARTWTLGKGDVCIIDAQGVPAPGESWTNVHLRDEVPANPVKGDLAKDGETWKIYDGEAWRGLGGGGGVESVNGKTGDVVLTGEDIEVGEGTSLPASRVLNDALMHMDDYGNPHNVTCAQIGAVADGDPRLTDARTPTAHAETHAVNGDDPITPISIGALSSDGGVVYGDITMYGSQEAITLEVGAGGYGGSVTVYSGSGHPASIKKDGNEVATEEQVDAAKTELNTRIDLIEATTKPNMNIVGSPKFSQGVVSGFSANDYLMFPTQVNVGKNRVDFYMSFTTGADVTTQQNMLDSWCGLAVAISGGHLVLAVSDNGTTFTTDTSIWGLSVNSSYNLKISFDYDLSSPSQYTVKAYIDGGEIPYCAVSLDGPVFPTATYWGGANPQSGVHHIFGGTINLNECRMDWNGTTVWRGYDELPTVKFDPTATPRLDTAEKIAAQSAYPMAAVVGGALKDRTVNHATAGGTFTFPARNGSNARDFVLVIDALTTAPTVTFPGGMTYVSEQDAADVWTAEADKVNAWYFTEQTDGVFMVCHKSMSVVAQ